MRPPAEPSASDTDRQHGRGALSGQKAKILAAAKKDGLTGAQVAKKFGVSKLTFYRWRGPVRSDAVARRGKRGPGRPKGSRKVRVDPVALSKSVQEQVRKPLRQIIREELEAALR